MIKSKETLTRDQIDLMSKTAPLPPKEEQKKPFGRVINPRSKNPGRTFTQPSVTIPEQTLSIREMILKQSQGALLPVQKTPFYDDGRGFGIDLEKMDLTDIQALHERATNTIREKKVQLKQERDRQREEENNRVIEEQLQERLKGHIDDISGIKEGKK